MHDRNIVNRDIKIDNILCKSEGIYIKNNSLKKLKIGIVDEHFKISDFSTAKQIKNNQYLFECAGTPGFRGPE